MTLRIEGDWEKGPTYLGEKSTGFRVFKNAHKCSKGTSAEAYDKKARAPASARKRYEQWLGPAHETLVRAPGPAHKKYQHLVLHIRSTSTDPDLHVRLR